MYLDALELTPQIAFMEGSQKAEKLPVPQSPFLKGTDMIWKPGWSFSLVLQALPGQPSPTYPLRGY